MAEWSSPIYVFFKTKPSIEYIDDRKAHIFECASGRCKARNGRAVRRYQDKGDKNSTSNLRKHAKVCWGSDAVAAADATRDVEAARAALIRSGVRDGNITAEFERIGKGKISFSTIQHTRTETRFVSINLPINLPLTPNKNSVQIVKWIAENKRPFSIVKDRGFVSLMKTGRPDYHLPSPDTVSRDVRNVFVRVRKRIAKMLSVN